MDIKELENAEKELVQSIDGLEHVARIEAIKVKHDSTYAQAIVEYADELDVALDIMASALPRPMIAKLKLEAEKNNVLKTTTTTTELC